VPEIGPKPFPERYSEILDAWKDPAARDRLPRNVREAYANWFEKEVSPNVTGSYDALAERFNRYRAQYLRGEVDLPPGKITDTHWRPYVPE
jgi:hypothetical protein